MNELCNFGECQDIVASNWQSDMVGDTVGSVLGSLKRCGRFLDSWNHKKRSKLRQDLLEKRNVLKEACNKDKPASWRIINKLENQLDEALSTEEKYWQQRARVNWIRGGDRNSRFFHSKASRRRARNKIRGLTDVDGNWRDSREDMEKIISNYFTSIFTTSCPSQNDIDLILEGVQPKISRSLSRFLDSSFSGEEIYRVVFEMCPSKAPGEDGFPASFYQRYWDTIGLSVVAACLDVLNGRAPVFEMNKTVITLIPKVQIPESMVEFRSISLCNVLYKIIVKVLTNKLRSVLGEIISENQCAYIPGRLINDNTIVGFECLHMIKRRKRKHGSMAIKLDMSKAYGRVEWILIKNMMLKLGFSSSRGLRQGDHLSPYLFLICAEGFSSLIHKAQLRGAIEGFKYSKGEFEISHRFFTDDSLLFTKANVANCTAVRKVLDIYAKASGQVVNFSKSALCVSPSISESEAERLATTVGIKLVDCDERYSVGGKEILIKAVIQSISIYAMSLFRLPKCLVDEIHSLHAQFWLAMIGFQLCPTLSAEESRWRINAPSAKVAVNQPCMRYETVVPTWGENLWRSPDERFYKVNCDALVDRKGARIGFGVVIRDSNGLVMASCDQGLEGSYNTKMAKTVAILKSI
ncbi:hypothetical protein Ddye_018452 [Dipteronia dyeriana]|uniref:Reverse transcriptase domain-containing protein n=1 Tax=Dipteronia dyeriana TaxID=168575 RepID=A0AAD9UB91_9ROSI|nr:hypothetical protein Ddye_018452 [Dipteronia dyeriana]